LGQGVTATLSHIPLDAVPVFLISCFISFSLLDLALSLSIEFLNGSPFSLLATDFPLIGS
jgi:hypothetical protein